MSLLTETLPIDRYANCFFGENFESALSVAQNGGVINGTPEISFGANFNGTTDYIVYNSSGWFLEKDPWSCHCIFYPDFATGEDANRTLFNTDVGSYAVWKRNNVSNNVLRISVGGGVIADVAEATYNPLWVVGGRNLVTVASTSGASDVWLNGTQIVTASATPWNPDDCTILGVGATSGGTLFFDGRIEMLKFYGTLLTESDHRYYWGQ